MKYKKAPFFIRILQNGEITFWYVDYVIFNQNHTSLFLVFLVFLQR